MIRPGEPWGSPTSSEPDIEIAGGDAALAAAASTNPGALVRFRPDAGSDLARAVGITPGAVAAEPVGTEVPLDLLEVAMAAAGAAIPVSEMAACNMCVFGTAPDRLRWATPAFDLVIELDGRPWFSGGATTAVIAIGQFLRGNDLVPRGHPGDGKAEIQVYDLARRERRPMRARLSTGAHVPHPRIHQRSARTITLRSDPPASLEVDGRPQPGSVSAGSISVVPGAYRLLV
jgi:hypothetical protein